MKFNDLRQAIINKITTEIPSLQSIDAHPGLFDLAELKRITTLYPAVRVSLLGSNSISEIENGENQVVFQMAATIATDDQAPKTKDEVSLEILEALMALIPGQRWGVTGVSEAQNVNASNLYDAEVDLHGVAMWTVTWDQPIRVGIDLCIGGTRPTEIYLSDDPDNFGNEPAYERVA